MLKDALTRMADVFLPSVLLNGKDYQQKGYVLNIRLSDGLLKARVKGRQGHIYDVHINLKDWPALPARCTCAYSVNCKHAAASLFTLQIKENLNIAAPGSDSKEHSLTDWLQTLREKRIIEATPPKTQIVVYLIEPHLQSFEHKVTIRLAMAKRLKRGGLGKKTIFNSLTTTRKQFFSPDDEEIISTLFFKCNVSNWFDRLSIRNSDLLQKILLTGRAYLFKDDEIEPLHFNTEDEEKAKLSWQLEVNGTQRVVLEKKGQVLAPVILDKLWYYDEDDRELGLLNLSYSVEQLKTLFAAPPVSLEQASLVALSMEHVSPDLPRPQTYEKQQIRKIQPRPVIRFDAIELEGTVDEFYEDNQTSFLFSRTIGFDYQGIEVGLTDANTCLVQQENDVLIKFERDFAFEKAMFEKCQLLLPVRGATLQEKLNTQQNLRQLGILTDFPDEQSLVRLHEQIIPKLEEDGWKVEFKHYTYDELLSVDDLEWFSEIKEEGNDFFAYQLGILVEGKQVSIVPLVADLINRLDRNTLEEIPDSSLVTLTLPEGKRLQLDMGRIKPLIRFLLQYGSRFAHDGQPLQISRYQLLLLQETEQALAATAMRWWGGDLLRGQLQKLVSMNDFAHVEIPKGLHATLRDYQHQGLNWLQFLRQSRFGGILADDMGLGKTVQTLAHLQLEKEEGRLNRACLIVAPTSLVVNWQEEAKRFTPELKVLVFHGVERHDGEFDNYDIVVSTYGLIQRDKSRFVDYNFYYLILDEAQSIKNARAKTTQIIQQIKADHRLCLSGTPLENNLGELWSLFHFLMPGLLGDTKDFRKFFKNPIEKNGDIDRRTLLAKRVKPFMLRRNKNEVANELPEKTEMMRFIELSGPQRDLYEAIRMSMEKKVREAISRQGMGKSHIVLLDALLKLRQVCCDPKLLAIPEAEIAHGTSAKLDALMDLLDNLVAEGRRVLVFSQFTSMLKLIEEQVVQRKYAYVKLTGQTQNRQQLVNTFQLGEIPIFLISLKAGGTGLNLTRADTVIHYDPWWNPAAEDQATDRSHRIGQQNPVFVYKLITTGTVEEAILAMQDKKRQLFEGILSEQSSGKISITNSDIDQFFMPLNMLDQLPE